MKNALNDIWESIDKSNFIVDMAERAAALECVIDQLKKLVDSGDDEAWYPLGYAYYCHPHRRMSGSAEAQRMLDAFNASIQIGTERALSHLYLAFHFYDMRDFEQAKVNAGLINEDDLEEAMAIRLNELKLCITISSKGVASSLVAISEYAKFIQGLSELAIPPLLLMDVLEKESSRTVMDDSIRSALLQLESAYPLIGKNGFMRLLTEEPFVRPAGTDQS